MKYKLDVFTIFIILLILLVLFMILNKWFSIKETKENFLDYNFDIKEDSNTDVSLPFYGTGKTVSHLYDNLYFDKTNGTVISLIGLQRGSGVQPEVGTIPLEYIKTIPRNTELNSDNITVTSHSYSSSTQIVPVDGMKILYRTYNCKDVGFVSHQSDISYNYQYFYQSWYKNTYMHLFKYDISTANTNKQIKHVRSFAFIGNGKFIFDNSTTDVDIKNIPTTTMEDGDRAYGGNFAKPDNLYNGDAYSSNLSKILSNITNNVTYDISYGNIITKNITTTPITYTIHNRNNVELNGISGDTAVAYQTSYNTKSQFKTGFKKVFNIKCNNVMVLVTVYDDNTIISVIGRNASKEYEIINTKRFNRTQEVTNLDTDTENKSASTTGNDDVKPKDDSKDDSKDKSKDDSKDKWSDLYNLFKKDCGDDPTCMYWYFQIMSNKNNDDTDISDIFSDDYFLKSEIVPPVCPQCPNCPSSSGVCTSCGGCGGSGINISSRNLVLTPIDSTTYKDKLGNIYIAYRDNSGNTKYLLQGNQSNNPTLAPITNVTPGPTTGTTISGNTANVANNLINNTADIVEGTGVLAYSAGSGAVNLLRDTGSGAVNLLRDAGSGISNLGQGQGQVQGQGQQSGQTQGQRQGQVSDSKFGNIQGYTPVDNYSYYGALQSKGGNFMPVTADFSSFRK
jgi:hypothetical protein